MPPSPDRAARDPRSGARRPAPGPHAHRSGSGQRRRRWWRSSPRPPPPASARWPQRLRHQWVGGCPRGRSCPLDWPRNRHRARCSGEESRRERSTGRGDRRPRGHRHPHHRGQAGRPRPADRRGRPRRLCQGGGEAARQGQVDRPRADRAPLRRRLLRRARRAGPAPVGGVRPGEEPALRRRRDHRLRHHRRPPDLRVLPGLHRLRRVAGRGLRREDHQGDGPRDEDRLPDHRHQRGRRRPHPGGGRLPRPLRRDLQAQRARLGGDPPDQPDHGLLRRRSRLLPRGHRLHDHGRRHLQHVHHRARRDQDRHRRGRHDGGARRRPGPQHQVGQRPLHGRRRGGRPGVHQGAALLPAPEQPRRGPDVPGICRGRPSSRSPTRTAPSTH